MTSKACATLTNEPATEKVQSHNEYEDAEKNFQLRSPKFWTIMLGMYLSIFLVALDRTIIAAAIPSITDEFNSIQDIGWYGTAYMLTAACFFPIFGRIYQLYSTKWTFLASIMIFEIGSAMCGAAPSSTIFITGRAIAGLGGAGIYSGGVMIILPLVPLRKRPVFIAVFGMAAGISSVLGPVIGGALTDQATWRWCFYLNLPIGGCTALVVLIFFNVRTPQREKLTMMAHITRLDPLGISLLIPSIVCLGLALQWGGSAYPWSSAKIIGLLIAFATLFIGFIVAELLRPDTAVAPPRVVLNRSVGGAVLFMFLLSGGLMSLLYYLTIWFQAIRGDSALASGTNTIPLILAFIVTGILSGICVQKVGYYTPIMLLSPVLCSVGAGMLSTLTPESSRNAWIGYQVLVGLGVGCGFQNTNLAVQNVLPRADVPLGMALIFFMQQLGGAVFLAVSQNVFSGKLIHSLAGVEGLDIGTIINTGVTDLRSAVHGETLPQVIVAYNNALTRVFTLIAVVSACMLLCALPIRWKRLPRKTDSSAIAANLDHKVKVSGEKGGHKIPK